MASSSSLSRSSRRAAGRLWRTRFVSEFSDSELGGPSAQWDSESFDAEVRLLPRMLLDPEYGRPGEPTWDEMPDGPFRVFRATPLELTPPSQRGQRSASEERVQQVESTPPAEYSQPSEGWPSFESSPPVEGFPSWNDSQPLEDSMPFGDFSPSPPATPVLYRVIADGGNDSMGYPIHVECFFTEEQLEAYKRSREEITSAQMSFEQHKVEREASPPLSPEKKQEQMEELVQLQHTIMVHQMNVRALIQQGVAQTPHVIALQRPWVPLVPMVPIFIPY